MAYTKHAPKWQQLNTAPTMKQPISTISTPLRCIFLMHCANLVTHLDNSVVGVPPPPPLPPPPPPTVLPSDCRFSKDCATAKWISQFPFFHMTLWVIVMHHHSKFGYKRLSTSEDIFWTKPDAWTDRHSDSSIPPKPLSCYTNSPCVIPLISAWFCVAQLHLLSFHIIGLLLLGRLFATHNLALHP